ncbi:MAG: 30S ribosomal protein S8 [Planctomycetes bacterium]|nr:30S ribosomal protein S8 [Planctomycetota bacterium]
MVMTDPIADLLTRIRNGILARKTSVDVPSAKTKLAVLQVLKEEGFIEDFEIIPGRPRNSINIRLKYGPAGESIIREIRRVSKPGLRIYRGVGDIKPVLNGMGMSVVSTSQGVLSDSEARKRSLGGEVLVTVW